jgi:uncharacterized protein (UPF0210 family)
MFGIPGDTPTATIAGIIADEMAIGVMNNKTTAVRVIPVPGKKPGETVDLSKYNDLLGEVIVMDPGRFNSDAFFKRLRRGRIPAPMRSLSN